ncbi:hypothetical protein LPA46_14390 [Halobacterium sp. KA-6]|nr:hypothetical protein [Halobacterium sp. KA-6]
MIIREVFVIELLRLAFTRLSALVELRTMEQLADYVDTLNGRITGTAERRFGIGQAADQWEGDIEASDDHNVL